MTAHEDRARARSRPGAGTTRGADDLVIDVIAAGLHPRVRSQADGSHYTSTGELPLVPSRTKNAASPDLPDLPGRPGRPVQTLRNLRTQRAVVA
jgi:hypothetical protein